MTLRDRVVAALARQIRQADRNEVKKRAELDRLRKQLKEQRAREQAARRNRRR